MDVRKEGQSQMVWFSLGAILPEVIPIKELDTVSNRNLDHFAITLSHENITLQTHFPTVDIKGVAKFCGLPFPSLGDLPDPGIKQVSLTSPALAGRFFTTSTTWEA